MRYRKFIFILLSSLLATISSTANNIKGAIEIPEGFESFGGKKVFVKYDKPIEDYDVRAIVYADSTVATGYRLFWTFPRQEKP